MNMFLVHIWSVWYSSVSIFFGIHAQAAGESLLKSWHDSLYKTSFWGFTIEHLRPPQSLYTFLGPSFALCHPSWSMTSSRSQHQTRSLLRQHHWRERNSKCFEPGPKTTACGFAMYCNYDMIYRYIQIYNIYSMYKGKRASGSGPFLEPKSSWTTI